MKLSLKTVWLFISSFGIMFAFLSWMQEAGVLSDSGGWWKGALALAAGLLLYFLIPNRMEE